jgi:hypothetical protein
VYNDERSVQNAEFCPIGVLDVFVSRNDAADYKAEGVGLICQYTSGGQVAIFVTAVADDSEAVGLDGYDNVRVVWVTTGFVEEPVTF